MRCRDLKAWSSSIRHVSMACICQTAESPPLATVDTYLFVKEEEINRLTTALECIRYGLTRGDFEARGGAKK